METFLALPAFVFGIHPHKVQWRGALMFSLIYARTSGSGNNRDARDFRRHPSHYDVTVINIPMFELTKRGNTAHFRAISRCFIDIYVICRSELIPNLDWNMYFRNQTYWLPSDGKENTCIYSIIMQLRHTLTRWLTLRLRQLRYWQ